MAQVAGGTPMKLHLPGSIPHWPDADEVIEAIYAALHESGSGTELASRPARALASGEKSGRDVLDPSVSVDHPSLTLRPGPRPASPAVLKVRTARLGRAILPR